MKQILKKSDYTRSSLLLKLAKSLDSCDPNEQQVYEILNGFEGNVTERSAWFILKNMMKLDNAVFVFRYFVDKIESVKCVFLYNVMINKFGQIRNFENAEKLFDEMLQRGVKPDVFTFLNLIRCAAVCSLPHKAVELFERMPAFGCEPDFNVSSLMIYVYARTGNVDMALKFYDSAKNEKWVIRPVAFSALIKMYGISGNNDGCLSVYNDMKVLGVRPNMVVYNALLYAMARAKRARDAKGVYQEMKKNGFVPNWETYSALLEAYSRGRLSKEALSVYKEMKEKGMSMNKVLYSMLLDMCADLGFVDEALEIFEDMKRSMTYQPDNFTYTSLIDMYSRNGKIPEAEAMLKEMISCGLEPDILVLTMFIHCYGKAKRTNDVVNIFNQFMDTGITPDDHLCDGLLYVMTQIPKEEHGKITNCIQKANPRLGYIVTYLMEESEGDDDGNFKKETSELLSSADDNVKKPLCNSLIDLCVKFGLQQKACNLLDLGLTLEIYSDIQSRSETQWCLNLKKLSIGAAMTAFHVWIDELSKAFESGEELPQVLGISTVPWRHKRSDKDLASVFESYLKELNSPFYKATNMAGWFFTTSQEAKSWLQSRGSTETVAGVKANLETYNNMLYGKAKRTWKAKAIYEEMLNNGISPNQSTYGAVLEAYCRGSYKDEALSVYKEMKEKGIGINRVLYNMLLKMCADVGYVDEAVEIFKDMKHSETCHPDSVTYSSLVNMYSCTGNFSEGEDMLNEMIGGGFEPNIFILTSLIGCYGNAKRTDDVVRIFYKLLDLGISFDDRLCVRLLHVMTQIPKQEHGKITSCIEKANPKLGFVVRYLMEEREGADFRKEALELFNSIQDYVIKKSLCNSLIDLCVNMEVQNRAHDLLDLGLSLEIYTDIQNRSQTKWSLHVKSLSTGAALTALHVWINDMSKVLESGEELPSVLGIYTGTWKHKTSPNVVESYMKEHNAPFQKDADMPGWFLTTNGAVKSWLQSRVSSVTDDTLNSRVLGVPTMALIGMLLITWTQRIVQSLGGFIPVE